MPKPNVDSNEPTLISIIAESTSDKEVYKKTEKILNENGIKYDFQILSAHRNPKELDDYIKSCDSLIYIAAEIAISKAL